MRRKLSGADRAVFQAASAYAVNQGSWLWQQLWANRAEERRQINSPWPVEPDTAEAREELCDIERWQDDGGAP